MNRRSTTILSIIIFLLFIVIGVGVWISVGGQNQLESQQKTQQTRVFAMNEVANHKSKDDCWTVISGNVYDLTEFIKRHPGGDEILRACGTDGTSLFNSRQTEDGQYVGSGSPHSQYATEQLGTLKIGEVKE